MSHFSFYVSFLFFFKEMSRAVSSRLFTVFDKRVITTQTIAGSSALFSFSICMMNSGGGRVGQRTSSNGSLRNIMDHSAPRINNKQGKPALVGGRGEKQQRNIALARKEQPLQRDNEHNSK